MLPDTVEYGEWATGVRAEGIIFGFISFVQKAALGIAVGLLGEVLGAIGYVANRPQAADTLADMRLVMLWVPIACAVAGGLFIWRYPIDAKTHARLVADIGMRRVPTAGR
jgi:GPH family glycoside/pentoside/hexuronide:cation symporter